VQHLPVLALFFPLIKGKLEEAKTPFWKILVADLKFQISLEESKILE